MRIKSDYENHTKEDLLTEAEKRGLDVPASTLKADVVAALQLSDEPAKDPEPEQPPAPLPPLEASSIPQVEISLEEKAHDQYVTPKDEEYTGGIYMMGDEPYALCVHEPNGAGKTHTLKNSRHFWQGTLEEFKAAFEKK